MTLDQICTDFFRASSDAHRSEGSSPASDGAFRDKLGHGRDVIWPENARFLSSRVEDQGSIEPIRVGLFCVCAAQCDRPCSRRCKSKAHQLTHNGDCEYPTCSKEASASLSTGLSIMFPERDYYRASGHPGPEHPSAHPSCLRSFGELIPSHIPVQLRGGGPDVLPVADLHHEEKIQRSLLTGNPRH